MAIETRRRLDHLRGAARARERARAAGCRAACRSTPAGPGARRSTSTPACSPARPRCRSTRASAAASASALLATAGQPAPAGLVVHTSGTTGAPQAGRAHAASRSRRTRSAARSRSGSTPTSAGCARSRSSHVGGLMVLLRSAIYATTAVLRPYDYTDVTLASMVPTQLSGCSTTGASPARGSAPSCSAARPRRSALLDPRQRAPAGRSAPTYGLTQACSQVTVGRARRRRHERLPDPRHDGRRSRPTARSSSTARSTPATSAASTPQGRLIVIGRKSDTIVTGGENVAPDRGRGRAARAPGGARRRRVRAPRSRVGGGGDGAASSCSRPTDPEELQRFAAERLAALQGPQGVRDHDASFRGRRLGSC